ncbi:MAG: polyprenyl diphosphate synthase [Candidatus Eremiobacteraeota bacterium]|nr:polyprenyl diphosphate synthase [Candidatus Eremiobacteraeota bacterium]
MNLTNDLSSKLLAQSGDVDLDPSRLPKHVAVIMDGNRRWARSRRLPAVEGHRRGIVALREATQAARDFKIPILTVYGFSTENWRRDGKEISLLLDLCIYFAQNELAELQRNNVRVNVIGRYEALPKGSFEALNSLVRQTASNDGLVLNLAVNYSARTELKDAIVSIARDVAAGRLDPASISDDSIASYLYTSDMPDPDILIRPGGEHRLSNFLLYQVAYTELYMTDVYWPDFTKDHFRRALIEFQKRQRRFGGA